MSRAAAQTVIVPDLNDDQLSEFRKIKKIGQGTYGSVYKVLHKSTGQILALKKMCIDGAHGEGIAMSAIREITSLKRLNHPNIVQLIHVFSTSSFVFTVVELMDYDLKQVLKKAAGIPLHPNLVKNFMWQIVHGVAFCHMKGIWHRDLKPENLLVSKQGRIKLADFGLAKTTPSANKNLSLKVVSLWYRSPELLVGVKKYTSAIDMWSVGCIFYELVTLNEIFQGESEMDQLIRIFQRLGTPTEANWPYVNSIVDIDHFPRWNADNVLPLLRQQMPKNGFELLMKLLAYDPSIRIRAKKAISDVYFADMEIVPLSNMLPPVQGANDAHERVNDEA